MRKAKEILKQYWGYEQFRPLQEDIVNDVIAGNDVFAILPTGGGKSVCFQVPGIAREGITIVISPLIALMQDQVTTLQALGFRAKALVSGMTFREIEIILTNAQFGGVDFLYVSPERIQTTLFKERFKNMKVGLLVVDEAHCISEWGHDFRPAFRTIHQLRALQPSVPLIALTATATQQVKEDIISQLELKNPKLYFGTIERINLSYESYNVVNKGIEILNFIQSQEGNCGIIYCQTRKSVKEIGKYLFANKIKIGIYHGGMNQMDRSNMLNQWLKNEVQVMISTNAFGMGIDKADVRFVLHYEFPPSLEAYLQEAGRAGRDGKPSRALTFWEEKDLYELENRLKNQFPPIETIKLTYRAICNYLKIAIGSGKDEMYHFDIQHLCKTFNLTVSETYHCLHFLELNGNLSFSEGFYSPTKVKYVCSNLELYTFQLKNEKFIPITTFISRYYNESFNQFIDVNELEIARVLKITKEAVFAQLKELEKFGIFDVSWRSDLPYVVFLHERLPEDGFSISPAIYSNLKENATRKLNAATSYLRSEDCRSVEIAKYFNQTIEACGICDNCRKNRGKTERLKDQLLNLLHLPRTEQELRDLSNLNITTIKSLLKELLLEEKISFSENCFQVC
ncbi:MAG: ATP-dependent DNA helicase RecQ [Bacteroidota bacterium]